MEVLKRLMMFVGLLAGVLQQQIRPSTEAVGVASIEPPRLKPYDPSLDKLLTATEKLDRSSFPEGFVFGSASSAQQFEGGVNEGGRGKSVWDTVAHIPGYTEDGNNSDIAVDQYHRYKEDVELMKEMGLDAYRFSIAWCRIFPDGLGPNVSKEGVAYYNRLLDALIEKGIQPWVTLYHWDLPQALEDNFFPGGWLSPSIVPAFSAFAKTCFEAFGDRVKHWITFNEPYAFTTDQANQGCKAPSGNCGTGKAYDEPYIAAHHVLLSHAAAVNIYRSQFMAVQGGSIGITLDAQWFEPLTNSPQDIQAAIRMQLFATGAFLDPIFFGDYPEVMRARLGVRLPVFSEKESQSIKGSVDFVGINHYTTMYARYYQPERNPPSSDDYISYVDPQVVSSWRRDGVEIGRKGVFLYAVPWGMQRILNWVKERYGNPLVYITENGMDERNNISIPLETALMDNDRIQFYQDYMSYMLAAIRDGANVRGYFVWSLLDNFEWKFGFNVRFGLYHIDYSNNLTRIPKASAGWFRDLLHQGLDSKIRKTRATKFLQIV